MTYPQPRVLTHARLSIAVALSLFSWSCSSSDPAVPSEPNYLIGSGAGDITSPVVDLPFAGYSLPTHIASGLHTRLHARAFIIAELDGARRLVFVTAELLNMSHEVRLSVVDNLRAKYGETYSLDNVVVSATHTHSSPAGYSHDGTFRESYFNAVVEGITEAIESAHETLKPGRILLGQQEVEAAGSNRSAVAYAQNPEAERARYANDTDKEMTLLKFETQDGIIGALSWFAVHPTSLTYNQLLVSADNKGVASFEMERRARERGDTGDGFVAAFAQSNCGDVTGNLNLDNTGPGNDEYDSARIIGERQMDVAMALLDSASEPLSGGVDYRLTAVDFTDLDVGDEFTGAGPQKTCFSAYGYSYAGGSTEDGGGHPLFMEGMLERESSLDALIQLVVEPPPVSDELRACHAPKPILFPKERQNALPVGVAKVGQLAIVFVPSEATTMSGRRLRDTVTAVLGDEAKYVMVAGYTNDYAGYITTPEEYAVQQYEGGHTLFGPWTLPAFEQEIDRLTKALANGTPAPSSADAGDLRGMVASNLVGNEYDESPAEASFGDLVTPPNATYTPGSTMTVAFWTGHPDNAYERDARYFEIQRMVDSDWSVVATEADASTKAIWSQQSRVIPPYDPLDPFAAPPPPINEAFTVTIAWQIPDDAEPGSYRLIFNGNEKPLEGSGVRSFVAQSPPFEVTSP
ncbi:MAG: neutral/alkaline non-lysosomal ceramidase N-terminal domain-containing protein [Polyangiales bacterium]